MEERSFHERCLDFGARIWRLVEEMPSNAAAKHAASQLFRSGTSVGANSCEARSAESRADFIHKMSVALKEAREAYFWLALVGKTRAADSRIVEPLLKECNELIAILAKSVITAKGNEATNLRR